MKCLIVVKTKHDGHRENIFKRGGGSQKMTLVGVPLKTHTFGLDLNLVGSQKKPIEACCEQIYTIGDGHKHAYFSVSVTLYLIINEWSLTSNLLVSTVRYST